MSSKVKLFSLANSNASLELIGPCKCVEGDTYAKVRSLIGGIHIVDWSFQFFDVESRCKINCKFEGLNKVPSGVYVSQLTKSNLDFGKCMLVVDLNFECDSQRTLEYIVDEAEIQDLTPLDDSDQPLPPPLGSRVSDESIVHVGSNLKSTLVSAEVMASYWLAEEKVRKDVKVITVEDHEWHLRSSD